MSPALAQEGQSVDATTQFAVARALVARSGDCKACHNIEHAQSRARRSSTSDAQVSRGSQGWLTLLAGKIRSPAAPESGATRRDAAASADDDAAGADDCEYMLSVNDKRLSSLPLQGTYTPTLPEGDSGRGSLVVRAIYWDEGAARYPPRAHDRSHDGAAQSASRSHTGRRGAAGRGPRVRPAAPPAR